MMIDDCTKMFIANINAVIKYHGIKPAEFDRMCGFPNGTYSRVSRNMRQITIANATKMSNAIADVIDDDTVNIHTLATRDYVTKMKLNALFDKRAVLMAKVMCVDDEIKSLNGDCDECE